MDSTDKLILLDLITYCRITYQEMAQKYGISANAIKKRVQKLINQGAIVDYFVELTSPMVNAENLMAMLTTDGSEDAEALIGKIGAHPMVSYVGKLAGGVYNAFGSYIGSSGLAELGNFLRALPAVKSVELHTLYSAPHPQKQNKLSTTQLMVLQYLVKDPRMAISEIAQKSGLTARHVRQVIHDLKDEGSITFTIHFNPNAAGIIALIRIHFSPQETNLNEVISVLQTRFSDEFFVPIISATNPLLFAAFNLQKLNDLPAISKAIKELKGVEKVITYMGEPNHIFPNIKTIRLKELLAEAGF